MICIRKKKNFSACGGAAIYRKKIMEKIGYFDEEHFAYLEDTDIGYRAEFMDMKTGMHRMQSYIMWEVVRVDPDIIISRPDILPEIIFI